MKLHIRSTSPSSLGRDRGASHTHPEAASDSTAWIVVEQLPSDGAETPSATTQRTKHHEPQPNTRASSLYPRRLPRMSAPQAMLEDSRDNYQECRVIGWLNGLRDYPPLAAGSSPTPSMSVPIQNRVSTRCRRREQSDAESLGILEYWTQKSESEKRLSRRWSEQDGLGKGHGDPMAEQKAVCGNRPGHL